MTEDNIKNVVNTFSINFISILYEALPFIILGAIIAGILEEFLPQRWITRLIPKRRWIAIFVGGLLGIIFPMCECGIIPVMRRLLRKGLPLSCCIAYLLAGPIINVVVILSTYTAFTGSSKTEEAVSMPSEGRAPVYTPARVASMVAASANQGAGSLQSPGTLLAPLSDREVAQADKSFQLNALWMAIFRVALGYIIAITTALIVDLQFQKHGYTLLKPLAVPTSESIEKTPAPPALPRRLANVSETALHDFIDITVFLILGAILASFVKLLLTDDDIERFSLNHAWIVIVGMMGLSIVLCLCSEADAFVAAAFTKLVPSAKLAFLVLGPMMDFKLFFMYTRVFRWRLIWTIILSVTVQVFVYCMILHFLFQVFSPGWMAQLSN